MIVLVLAGTAEARGVATLLAQAGIKALASFAGVTNNPAAIAIPSQSGGFGGEAEQRHFMQEHRIRAIIDATHPFASHISNRTTRLSVELGIPYVNLCRPAWEPAALDDWTQISMGQEAQRYIPVGATVFLATGRQTLLDFDNLKGRKVICRIIDPPHSKFPFKNGEYVIGQPPFSVKAEMALFKSLKINWLVVKNSGGALGLAKLEAARAMGIPVLMIARPKQPAGDSVTDPAGALEWLQALNKRHRNF